MKSCYHCQNPFPIWQIVEGKRVNTQSRKFCFDCSPYKSHNTRDLNKPKPKFRHNGSETVKVWRKRFKTRIVASLGGKCQCCGYDRCADALEAHHLDPRTKEMSFGGVRGHPRAWKTVIKELRKCVLLCCLCHREVHAGVRAIPETTQGFDEQWADYRTMEMAPQTGVEPVPNRS